MTEKNRIGLWLPAVVVAAIVLVIGAVIHRIMPGVYVTVVNHGPATLHSVTIQVTGRAYFLGDLGPGQSPRRRVSPTTDSHVEIEYLDESGRQVTLNAGGYLGPEYRGEIVVQIRNGQIESRSDDTTIYFSSKPTPTP